MRAIDSGRTPAPATARGTARTPPYDMCACLCVMPRESDSRPGGGGIGRGLEGQHCSQAAAARMYVPRRVCRSTPDIRLRWRIMPALGLECRLYICCCCSHVLCGDRQHGPQRMLYFSGSLQCMRHTDADTPVCAGNRISEGGGTALGAALEVNTVLQELDIGSMPASLLFSRRRIACAVAIPPVPWVAMRLLVSTQEILRFRAAGLWCPYGGRRSADFNEQCRDQATPVRRHLTPVTGGVRCSGEDQACRSSAGLCFALRREYQFGGLRNEAVPSAANSV